MSAPRAAVLGRAPRRAALLLLLLPQQIRLTALFFLALAQQVSLAGLLPHLQGPRGQSPLAAIRRAGQGGRLPACGNG